MKTILGTYAKIIILSIAVIGIVTFLLSSGRGSFQSMIPQAKATVGKEDSGKLMDDIAARPAPVITVKKVKLKAGNRYNVKIAAFVSAVDADDEPLSVKIERIIQPDGSEIAVPETGILQVKKGVYQITYSAQETYKTVIKRSEKTAIIVVD